MLYDDFIQKFLTKFSTINSFKGKLQFANQNLNRIGSGSGRAVYDIDGTKVLKLAINSKGIAQNEVESNIGYYDDVSDIVTKVFDNADDNTWLVAEEAKKVNEKRIKELTGIPSLNELFYYLKNFDSYQHGTYLIFRQKLETRELLEENEFVQTLTNFIENYDQKNGDMGRPSTYGEVLRDGQPTIVLTDYGLNDEVYNTHYSPKRNNRIYELYNFADGNDDILSDIGNTHEVRQGMWALMPYGVGNGDGVVNEDFVQFVSNRDYYPARPLPAMPYLMENFHNCVNSLKEVLNKVHDKKKFYKNLIKLQEYLTKQGFYDREPLRLNESNMNESAISAGLTRKIADQIAIKVADVKRYGKPKYIGEGAHGFAYGIGNNMILKVTSDQSEAIESLKVKGLSLKHLANIYDVFEIAPSENLKTSILFVIICEKLITDIYFFNREVERLDYAFEKILGFDFNHIFDDYLYYPNDDYLDKKPAIDKYLQKNPEDAKFYYGLLGIADETKKYGIKSNDFFNTSNLGYKRDGSLGFFDMGFGDIEFSYKIYPEKIEMNEDGSSLYSTDNSIGQDNIQTHNNNDTSPSIQNDLSANSNLYNEDLEYSHASDATKDEYVIDESIQTNKVKLIDIYAQTPHRDERLWNFIGFEDYEETYFDVVKLNVREVYLKYNDGEISNNLEFATEEQLDIIKYYMNNINKHLNDYFIVDVMGRLLVDGYHRLVAFYKKGIEEINAVDLSSPEDDEINERQLSSMKGSSTVNVKKKCRLGGLGNTSAPCNQGDISNLNIKPLDEETDAEYDFYDLMSRMTYDVFSAIKNKRKIKFNLINPIQYKNALSEYMRYGKFIRFPSKIIYDWKSLVLYNIALLNSLTDIHGHSSYFPFDEYYDAFNIPEEEQNNKFDDAYKILNQQYDIDSYVPFFSNGHAVLSDYGLEPLFKLAKLLLSQNTPEEIIVTINKILDIIHQRGDLAELFIKGGLAAQYSISNGDVINEENELEEGVGDKYAEKFGVEPEFKDFDDRYEKNQNIVNKEDIVYNEGNYSIIRNPKSFKNIKADVRGVIDDEGNLYIEQSPKKIHLEILKILFKLGLVKRNEYNWRIYLPENFITVQRYHNTNKIIVGESNTLMLPDYFRTDEWWNNVAKYDDAKNLFQKYFDKAKIKNPNIDFINENIYIYKKFEDPKTSIDVEEGVGDKYVEKKYNLEPEFSDFDDKYGEMNASKEHMVVYNDSSRSHMIIKNPITLKSIGANVRGIIDKEGNFYVEQRWSSYFMHDKILEILNNLNLVKNIPNWHIIMPTEFITVTRYHRDNLFLIGESNRQMIPNENREDDDKYNYWKDVPDYNDAEPVFQQFINKARAKNPNINFENINILYYGDNQLDENIDFDNQIKKDNTTHQIDKNLINNDDKYNETVKIYAVNGDEVRDSGFIEWVDGGHHYVDASLPEDEQKYAKNIPEDEIWIDDVFLSKPNDMSAIILHERLERYLMKHFGMSYDTAHADYANKAETVFRNLVKNGTGMDAANKIFATFVNKYKKLHPSKREMKLNEVNIMSLQDLPFKSEVEQLGGKTYQVGGSIRDEFLGKESKDLDILITGIPMDELEQILSKYGRVDVVGKSFGVLKFKPEGSSEDIDVAIPRIDKMTDAGGHKGFEITSDHALPIENDLFRRDFTINAIAKDSNGNIIDPYNGREDLKNKIIRAVNPEAFSDDPLRMMRAIGFASRFGFTIEPETMKMIQANVEKIKEIPAERILTEFGKIVSKGDSSIGMRLLMQTGLYEQIFAPARISFIGRPFDKVKTMGEFIYLLIYGVIDNPADFYRNTLKGDIETYKEIKALELAYATDSTNPIAARSIAHNMYLLSPLSLQSNIIPVNVKKAANELLTNKYPKTIEDLDINGNDLMTLGLKGKEIGDAMKMMLLKIYSDKIKNNKEDLLNSINLKSNLNEEVYENIEYGCLMLYLNIPEWNKITSIIKPEDIYDKKGFGIEKESHVTILYGFHNEVTADEVFDLYKENEELKPIKIIAKGISVFENSEYDVVKFDVESEKLNELNKLMKRFPHTSDFPNYHPHMTIAYVKKGTGKYYIKDFKKEKTLVGNELVFTWKGHKGKKGGKTLKLNNINESSGDKYVEKEYNLEPEFNSFEKKYQNYINNDKKEIENFVFYQDEYHAIVKNPKNLRNISANVRGVVDKYGNLYVETNVGGYIHNDILEILEGLRIIKNIDYEHWHIKIPTEFITVQRDGKTNIFDLGESCHFMKNQELKEIATPIVEEFLSKAKIKNPKIDFNLDVADFYSEGVGDKYAEKAFGIPNTEDSFRKKLKIDKQLNIEQPVAYVKRIGIYKNPKSLTNFDSNVRAITDSQGNLYVAIENGDFVHGEMGFKLGFINIYDNLDRYTTLNRIENSNSFGLSDSEIEYMSSTIDKENYFSGKLLLEKVKKRNPQFDFYLKYYESINLNSSPKVNENIKEDNNIAYSAIVLDDQSHNKLVKVFSKMIPEGWEVIADHVTLNMGNIKPEYEQDLGKQINLNVIDYAIDDKVMAVGVEGYQTSNAKAHITLAVNRQDGGKPFMSNKLQDWKSLGFPLKLTGIVTEVERINENIIK